MIDIPRSRVFLWVLLALPGAVMASRWAFTPASYGYGHAIGESGDWAAWLLMATLAVTPLRLAFTGWAWTKWLTRHRRDLGVASFAYALGHTVIYLQDKADIALIVEQALTAELLVGWIAFALFVPLAITSNDRSVRFLRRSWKKLHRLVYPAAILVFLHWVLTAFDPTTAWIHAGILAAIEILRVWLQRSRRRPRA